MKGKSIVMIKFEIICICKYYSFIEACKIDVFTYWDKGIPNRTQNAHFKSVILYYFKIRLIHIH